VRLLCFLACAVIPSRAARAQATPVDGASLVFQSSGTQSSTSWTLGNAVAGNNGDGVNGVGNNSDGYVGTYIQVPSGGSTVSFTVNASGIESGTTWPDMTISVAGENTSFSVDSTSANNYTATVTLPGDPATDANGTYLVRVQLDNQSATATPDLTVNSLSVSGATVDNVSNNTTALDAAQTYADEFRSGPGAITLTYASGAPVSAGTPVQVKLTDNAFNFADAVVGNSNSSDDGNPAWLVSNPAAGSYAYEYQQALLSNFNAIVPSNAGKWSNNEPVQNDVTMSFVDQLDQFAAQNNLQMRMHNLIWNSQQPTWVNNLFTTIKSGGTAGATAKTNLSTAIQNRINYYINATNPLLGNKLAQSYAELDVFNEPWHGVGTADDYWTDYGAAGIANIYNEAAAAVAAAGAKTRLYVNEYNVLQYSADPLLTSGAPSDPYANWYLALVNDIRNQNGAVSGIGVEDYINTAGGTSTLPTPTSMMEALQNLSVDNLPISLTEFGTSTGAGSIATASTLMTETMTMIYGTPLATTMGFWGDLGGPGGTGDFLLYNSSWDLTAIGQAYEQWMAQYNTNLSLSAASGGLVNFNGTYGQYAVTIGGEVYNLTLTQGANNSFNFTLPNPQWNVSAGGDWNTVSNWTDGIPNGPGAEADLFSAIATGSTISNSLAVTLGTLHINSPQSYLIDGSGSLTFQGLNSNPALIQVDQGSQEINQPVNVASNLTINIAAGATLTLASPLTINSGISVTPTGAGIVSYQSDVTLQSGASLTIGNSTTGGALSLAADAKVAVAASASTPFTVQFNSVSLAGGASIDLTDNNLIVSYGSGTSPIALIQSYLTNGYNNGAWNGAGIFSSSVASLNSSQTNLIYSVGYADGADGITGVPAGEIEVMPTLAGDAKMQGNVVFGDFQLLSQYFGQTDTTWDEGDFTYNGTTNFGDFQLLSQNFGANSSALTVGEIASLDSFAAEFGDQLVANSSGSGFSLVSVPEPASLGLITGIAVGIFVRRKRK
jgi:GH35 family endo-1,4-beta-xylanase